MRTSVHDRYGPSTAVLRLHEGEVPAVGVDEVLVPLSRANRAPAAAVCRPDLRGGEHWKLCW